MGSLLIRHHHHHHHHHIVVGRFPFNQNFRFEFPATSSSEWNSIFRLTAPVMTIFRHFQKRGQPLEVYSNFRKIFPEVFFPFYFAQGISKIFGWMVRISEIQQFPEFLETFPGNFCTICRCFQIFILEVFLIISSMFHSVKSKRGSDPLLVKRHVTCHG